MEVPLRLRRDVHRAGTKPQVRENKELRMPAKGEKEAGDQRDPGVKQGRIHMCSFREKKAPGESRGQEHTAFDSCTFVEKMHE